jgi:C4-dicarboxylate transporter DctM subunit
MRFLYIFLLIFFLLAFIRVPVSFSMGISAVATYFVAGLHTASIAPALYSGLNSFTYLAIPAFVLAGDIMGACGISKRIVDFVNSFIGRFRGSLGAVAVVTSALFGTLTGSSLATVSTICGMMLPEMERAGYSRQYSTALIASAGFLGILIPPSIPGIVYAMMSGDNLMEVWLCTVGPGILITIVFCLINFWRHGRHEEKTQEPFCFNTYITGIGTATKDSLLALLMPVIIFYGIYGGIFTPTEAGGVSVLYGLIAGFFLIPLVYKQRPQTPLTRMISNSALSSASICMIIAFSAIAGRMITMTRIPSYLTEFMMGITNSRWMFLVIVNILLIIVGIFMDSNASILILGPVLIPMAEAYGVNTTHFAAIMLLNLEIGFITPPMAGNLFVACRISGLSIDEIIKDLIPFFLGAVVVLIITTYFPAVATFLPNLIRG